MKLVFLLIYDEIKLMLQNLKTRSSYKWWFADIISRMRSQGYMWVSFSIESATVLTNTHENELSSGHLKALGCILHHSSLT